MGKKILVVEDEKDIQIFLKKLFEENGYDVSCASDGDEALKAVGAGKPDLITLDMSMPHKSGARFYREIRSGEATGKIPVIIVTGIIGQGGAEDTEKFYSTRGSVPPPDGFIAKPIDREELVGMVAKLMQ